jgi:hypothetical protein
MAKSLQVSGMGGKQTINDETSLKAARRHTRLFDELINYYLHLLQKIYWYRRT